jgi:hypothetical protein
MFHKESFWQIEILAACQMQALFRVEMHCVAIDIILNTTNLGLNMGAITFQYQVP